jgi:RND family efflux transporter MFP subunit
VSQQKLALCALVAVVALQCGCTKETSAIGVAAAAPQPKETTLTQPGPPVPAFYETSGPLVVENQVDVLAQREGVLARITVDVGQRVTKGQLLAEIDNRQLRADRDAADAKMLSTEADMKTEEAEAHVLDSDFQRDKLLYEAQVISDKQLEHSKYKKDGSAYLLEREKQNNRNAQATLRSLDLELEKTRIVAPFSGVVARRYVRVGQKITANDRLFWVTETSPVSVQFTLPENFAGQIKTGQEVTVISPFHPDQKHVAKVRSVSPVVDPSSGTIEVRAELVDHSADLLPGTSANVRVARAK